MQRVTRKGKTKEENSIDCIIRISYTKPCIAACVCKCAGVGSAGVICYTCCLLIWFAFAYADFQSDLESDSTFVYEFWLWIRFSLMPHRDGKQIYVQLKGSNVDWKLTDKCVCLAIVVIIYLPWGAQHGERGRLSRCSDCLQTQQLVCLIRLSPFRPNPLPDSLTKLNSLFISCFSHS